MDSNIALWMVHEVMEAIFHFVLISYFLISGDRVLAALIHLLVDLYHEAAGLEMNSLQHRALHFTVESIFFIAIFGL